MTALADRSQQELFNHLTDALGAAGEVTDDYLVFVEQTLFAPDPDRLAEFLTDETNSDRESLLDLIFSPDETVQMRLEPLLESSRFSETQFAQIQKRVMQTPISANLRLSDGHLLATIELPDWIKKQYLDRLHIAWCPDPQLPAAVDAHAAAELRLPLKVRLRNAGMAFSAAQTRFFCRFVERMDAPPSEILACLDLVLTLLDQREAEDDIYERLVACKQTCFRSLQQAQRFDQLLGRSNMETLMLQGVRPPPVSEASLRHRMQRIDRICMSVFGRTEVMQMPVEEPMRQVDGLDHLTTAMRSL